MTELEQAIVRWHAAVNSGDADAARAVVADPIVVLGPRGAGTISGEEFGGWVVRSGIRLIPTSWHPVSDRVMVVEEDAVWPESAEHASVATVFRSAGTRISAALRFPDLASALELASIHRELAVTE